MPPPKRPKKLTKLVKTNIAFPEYGDSKHHQYYTFSSQQAPDRKLSGVLALDSGENKVRIISIGTSVKQGNEWKELEWNEARNTNPIGHLRGLFSDLKSAFPQVKGRFTGQRETGIHRTLGEKTGVWTPQTSWSKRNK